MGRVGPLQLEVSAPVCPRVNVTEAPVALQPRHPTDGNKRRSCLPELLVENSLIISQSGGAGCGAAGLRGCEERMEGASIIYGSGIKRE